MASKNGVFSSTTIPPMLSADDIDDVINNSTAQGELLDRQIKFLFNCFNTPSALFLQSKIKFITFLIRKARYDLAKRLIGNDREYKVDAIRGFVEAAVDNDNYTLAQDLLDLSVTPIDLTDYFFEKILLKGKYVETQLLLENKKIEINLKKTDATLLCAMGSPDYVDVLRDKGALNLDQKLSGFYFHCAITYMNLPMLDWLIQNHYEFNPQDYYRESPLVDKIPNKEIIKWLYEHGVDLAKPHNAGKTLAASILQPEKIDETLLESLDQLVKFGVDISRDLEKYGTQAVINAIRFSVNGSNNSVINWLLSHKVPLNKSCEVKSSTGSVVSQTPLGETVLSEKPDLAIITLLLKSGADSTLKMTATSGVEITIYDFVKKERPTLLPLFNQCYKSEQKIEEERERMKLRK